MTEEEYLEILEEAWRMPFDKKTDYIICHWFGLLVPDSDEIKMGMVYWPTSEQKQLRKELRNGWR